jgi:protein-tyrosine phosphatase
MVARAQLVLTATRQHRAAVVALSPRAVRRTFTLLEFGALVRLAELDRVPGAECSMEGLLGEAQAVRGLLPHQPNAFDIADPYGAPQSVHNDVAARIQDALALPIRLIAGLLT